MMSPPEMPELGPIPALPPPPVAAYGASTSAVTIHEQRPDSGIDLSNGGSTAGSYETNGIFTKEHALHGTLTDEPNALVSHVNARDQSYDNVHEGFHPAREFPAPIQAMTSSPTTPSDLPLPNDQARDEAQHGVVARGTEQHFNLQTAPLLKDSNAYIMQAEPPIDDHFRQATEFPGFHFKGDEARVDHSSNKRPYSSGSATGAEDEERPASRQRSNNGFAISSNAQKGHDAHYELKHPEPQPTSTEGFPIPSSSTLVESQAIYIQPPVDPAPIEPAPSEHSETEPTVIDSAFDDGASASFSITDTLNSSVSNYRWENGRRYHAYRDGAYWGPNDELHNDQQDIAHKAWTLSIGDRLFKAPLDGNKLQRALDVGTGTGLWAIEFAEMFPNAQVTGTDLSPIQPNWVPPNCMFEVDDVTLEWTFRKNSFDFIHSREMFGSIADWDFFFAQCYAHCKPGGYVECLERGVKPLSDDDTVGPDHFYTLWGQTVLDMGRRWGKGFDAFEIIKEKMEQAGFVDVMETKMKWPIGGWPKDRALRELGMWNAVRLDTGIEGYVMRLFTHAGGWSYAEVQTFLAKFRACMRDPSIHAYLPGTCVYGRKPLNSTARNSDILVNDEGVEFT